MNLETPLSLQTLSQAFFDVYFHLDAHGVIVDFSAARPSDLYAPPADFLGRKMSEVLPPEVGQLFDSAMRNVVQTKQSETVLYSLSMPGGERHFEARLVPSENGEFIVAARDVTALSSIRAEREQLVSILEATTDFVGTCDIDGRIRYLNRTGRQMLGLCESETPEGRSILELHPPQIIQLLRETAIPTAMTEGVWSGETTLLCRDGSSIPVSQVVLAHSDENGTIEFLSTIIRDISPLRAAAEELRQSQQLYQRLFAANPLPLWVFDLETLRFLEVNEAAVANYGYSREEFLAMTIRDIRPTQDLERLDAVLNSDRPSLHASGYWQHRRKDGSVIDVEITSHDLIFQNRAARVVLAHDITEQRRTEQALRETEAQYRSIFENAIEGIFQTTPAGSYRTVNPKLAEIYGYASPDELINSLTDIRQQLYVDPNRREEFARLMSQNGRVENFESAIRRKDGSIIWISENARAVCDNNKVLLGYEGTVVDITDRVRAEAERMVAEEALRDSENRLRDIVEHSSNLFYSHTTNHVLTYISPQARSFFDCEPAEALVHWTRFATDHPINQEGLATCQRAIDSGVAQPVYQLELAGVKGRKIWVEVNEAPVVRDGKTVAIVGALVDITKRKAVEQQLKHQAFHDSLTNLPNRALFMDRLQHAIESITRRQGYIAVLFLDLDRFKIVNDSLGHEVGDQLLQSVSRRLRSCTRPGDTIARLGGDEFTVLMEDISNENDAIHVAERIAQELQQPFNLLGHEVFVTTSIGIALSQSSDDHPDALLRDADVAMYRAKNKGRAQYEVFDPEMNARALERLTIETDLWQAIGRNELRVCYQPKVNIRSGRIVGFEALVRWQHPRQGLISPLDFIPLAEETGMILSIGHWVLREACAQARRWQEMHPEYAECEMSVNLSARQLQQPDLGEEIARVLQETGFSPHLLKLEITESVVMGDAEITINTLRELKALGVQLAIDDFGTGYSSLAYLRRFPVNTLKIDRAFIRNLGVDVEDTEIVRAIISLAQTLGLSVTAEGVENDAQLAQLRDLSCDWAQGYLFAEPLSSDAVLALLSQPFVASTRFS